MKLAAQRTFWNRFKRNHFGLVGLGMLLLVAVVAIFAPWLSPYDPESAAEIKVSDIYKTPSVDHVLGTDDAGKDVLSNLIYGARVSLIVGIFASIISVFIGGVLGIVAGYFGGRSEMLLMRFTDVMLVIPDLPLMVVIVAMTKPSLVNIILVIGLLGWTTTARLVRSQVLAIKQRVFVQRSRALGASNAHIIVRHILPMVAPLIVVNTVLVISLAILNESALSFLGLGDPTTLSWGQMMNYAFGRGAMSAGAWWALVAPGFGIVWVVLGCSMLGHGLEKVLNPRLEIHHLAKPKLPSLDLAAPQHSVSEPGSLESEAQVLLDIQNMSVIYRVPDTEPLLALQNINLSLRRGEILGLVGESGCGKTTMMLSILRLLPENGQITAGEINFRNQNLLRLSEQQMDKVRWHQMAIVFQGAMNALNPVRTIGDQIGEPLRVHLGMKDDKQIQARVAELLDFVGINPTRSREYPHQYSGGMRQRAMIAMALACNPEVLIADEPTTALDVMIQAQILELLGRLRKQLGLSVIIVTHDLGVVAEVCDRVQVMYSGMNAEIAPVDRLFNFPQHPYTKLLIQAFPDLRNPQKSLASIAGYPPRLDSLPPGCLFEPRCPKAFELCKIKKPSMVKVGTNQFAACHLLENQQ